MIKYILQLLKYVANGFIKIGAKYCKPFLFSTKRPNQIIAPYAYVLVGMLLFFSSIVMFLYLSYAAATKGIQDSAIVLPTLAGVIATLIAMVGIMIKLYNDGKDHACEITETEEETSGDPIKNPEA